MSKASTKEYSIEAYLVKRVRETGGMALKGDTPGRRFLDRICILPDGVTLYVEVKRPKGGRATAHQLETMRRLKALGHLVALVKTTGEIDDLLRPFTDR